MRRWRWCDWVQVLILVPIIVGLWTVAFVLVTLAVMLTRWGDGLAP